MKKYTNVKKHTNNSFKVALQSKIAEERMTANIIANQYDKAQEKRAFENAFTGCLTRAKWFDVYETMSDKALRFARENDFFSVMLDGKNAYETAIITAIIEACGNNDESKLICRVDGFFTASPYSFYVNACKLRDFKVISNRPEAKRLLLWKVNKGVKGTTSGLFELDANGKNIPHEGATQADYVLRVLCKLGAMDKIGVGSEAYFQWNKDSPVTKALSAFAE